MPPPLLLTQDFSPMHFPKYDTESTPYQPHYLLEKFNFTRRGSYANPCSTPA